MERVSNRPPMQCSMSLPSLPRATHLPLTNQPRLPHLKISLPAPSAIRMMTSPNLSTLLGKALSITLKPTPTQSSSRTRMVTLLKLLTNGAIDARVHLDAPSRAHVTKNVPTRRLVNRKCLSTHLTTERLQHRYLRANPVTLLQISHTIASCLNYAVECFHMDSETATAFNHAFAALGAGSAMWQGSHTYLGNQADNQLTSVVAFLIHQAIVGGLAETGGHLDIDHLINLQAQRRQRTAVQTASDITSIFTSQDISEWAQEFVDLDVPEYESTFVVIISSIITTMFPDRDATALLTGLTNIFRGNPEELNIYLPILRDLLVNLNLSDEKKFVLFWQLLGVACKMVFAFLWQEKVIQIDLFLEPGTNELGPKIMPTLVSLFNFVTGFEHVDESFQKFEGMFPGDKACRETVPHSKWHELSDSALLDMVYLSDCLAAVVTGSDGFGCAHLSNLESSTEITRSEVSDWVNTNIVVPNIPIVKDVVPLFIEEIFMLFDLNDNDKIEWIDIEKTLFQTLSNQSLEQSKVSFRELRTFAPPTKVTAPPLTNSVTHFNLAVEKSEKMACSPASRTVNLLGSMR